MQTAQTLNRQSARGHCHDGMQSTDNIEFGRNTSLYPAACIASGVHPSTVSLGLVRSTTRLKRQLNQKYSSPFAPYADKSSCVVLPPTVTKREVVNGIKTKGSKGGRLRTWTTGKDKQSRRRRRRRGGQSILLVREKLSCSIGIRWHHCSAQGSRSCIKYL